MTVPESTAEITRSLNGAGRVPRLHVVTTREILEREGFVEAARQLVELDAVALHLRARGDNGRLLLECARELSAAVVAARSGTRLLVNDRVDVAAIAGTGAHLPEAGLTPAEARTILGSGPLLGRSLHGDPPEGFGGSDLAGLDYVFYGHVFPTRSKPGAPARGLEGLAFFVSASARTGFPVIAIGGVTPERVGDVLREGAHGVAVVSGIWDDPAPTRACRRYLRALDEALTRLRAAPAPSRQADVEAAGPDLRS